MFPEAFFGEIPVAVTRFLFDSGFDRFVTLATLSKEDIEGIEKENPPESKLKLGHKRLIIQMVQYAKNLVEREMAAHSVAAKSQTLVTKGISKTSSATSAKTKNITTKSEVHALDAKPPVNHDADRADRDENVKKILHQSLKKSIQKFCDTNSIGRFDIVKLDVNRSSVDGVLVFANVTCICGDIIKVYTNSTSTTAKTFGWITSNISRHLYKKHLPKPVNTATTIMNFMTPKSKPINDRKDGDRHADDAQDDADEKKRCRRGRRWKPISQTYRN